MNLLESRYLCFVLSFLFGLGFGVSNAWIFIAFLGYCVSIRILSSFGRPLFFLLLFLYFFLGLTRGLQYESNIRSSLPTLQTPQKCLVYVQYLRQTDDKKFAGLVLINQGDSFRGVHLSLKLAPEEEPIEPGSYLAIHLEKVTHRFRSGRWSSYVSSYRDLSVVEPSNLGVQANAYVQLLEFRKWVQDCLSSFLSKMEAQTYASFLGRALLGDRSEGSSIRENMKNLGLAPLFAISGFHVTLLGVFLWAICSLLFKKSLSRFIAYLCGLLVYGLLVGFSVSVLRAVAFSTLLMGGKVVNRPSSPVRILAIGLLLHSFLLPGEVFQAGFQLSYGITFFLLAFSRLGWSSWWIMLLVQVLSIPYFLMQFQEYPVFTLLSIPLGLVMSLSLGFGFVFLFVSLLPGLSFLMFYFLYPVARTLEALFNFLNWMGGELSWRVVLTQAGDSTLQVLLFFFYCFLLNLVLAVRGAAANLELEHYCEDLKKQIRISPDLSRITPNKEWRVDAKGYSYWFFLQDCFLLTSKAEVRAAYYGPLQRFLRASGSLEGGVLLPGQLWRQLSDSRPEPYLSDLSDLLLRREWGRLDNLKAAVLILRFSMKLRSL